MQSKRDTVPDPPSGSVPEPRDSAERVTISNVPRSLEAASGPRRAYAEVIELPAPWLERLVLLCGQEHERVSGDDVMRFFGAQEAFNNIERFLSR